MGRRHQGKRKEKVILHIYAIAKKIMHKILSIYKRPLIFVPQKQNYN